MELNLQLKGDSDMDLTRTHISFVCQKASKDRSKLLVAGGIIMSIDGHQHTFGKKVPYHIQISRCTIKCYIQSFFPTALTNSSLDSHGIGNSLAFTMRRFTIYF